MPPSEANNFGKYKTQTLFQQFLCSRFIWQDYYFTFSLYLNVLKEEPIERQKLLVYLVNAASSAWINIFYTKQFMFSKKSICHKTLVSLTNYGKRINWFRKHFVVITETPFCFFHSNKHFFGFKKTLINQICTYLVYK